MRITFQKVAEKPIGKIQIIGNKDFFFDGHFTKGKTCFLDKSVHHLEDNIYTMEGEIIHYANFCVFKPTNAYFIQNQRIIKELIYRNDKPRYIIVDKLEGLFVNQLPSSIESKFNTWVHSKNLQKSLNRRNSLLFVSREIFEDFWNTNY